ncbi:MAG TPA: hypothetical protein VGG47_15035 [Acidocella sp.]|jgi:hypothetical protein
MGRIKKQKSPGTAVLYQHRQPDLQKGFPRLGDSSDPRSGQGWFLAQNRANEAEQIKTAGRNDHSSNHYYRRLERHPDDRNRLDGY